MKLLLPLSALLAFTGASPLWHLDAAGSTIYDADCSTPAAAATSATSTPTISIALPLSSSIPTRISTDVTEPNLSPRQDEEEIKFLELPRLKAEAEAETQPVKRQENNRPPQPDDPKPKPGPTSI